MKRFFNKSKKSESQEFYVLTSKEMLKVRGGRDTKPPSREKDFFDLEEVVFAHKISATFSPGRFREMS